MLENSNQNLLTLQTLLRKLPECDTPDSQRALLSLIYTEALPIVRVILFSILRKKQLYKSMDEIYDLCHDSATKLVYQYLNRPDFEMKHVRNYLYLMVQAELFNYNDKRFNQRHCQLLDEDETIEASIEFYGDAEYKQQLTLDSMLEDLGEHQREFVAYFGQAVQKNTKRKHPVRFKRAVEATKHIAPPRFFYVHLDGLLALEEKLL